MDQGEPPREAAGDGARRGGEAGGDGAVRREIRRLGPRRRGRWGLPRALRRDPRHQHRRDRDLQDRLRGVERGERAPDRGADRPGGDRLVPRARGSLREVGELLGPRRTRWPGPAARPSVAGGRRGRQQAAQEELGAEADRWRRRRAMPSAAGESSADRRRPRPPTRNSCSSSPTGSSRSSAPPASSSAAQGEKVGPGRAGLEGRVARGFSASDVIGEVAPIIGGGGGGRDDMAQAGGREPAKLDAALGRGPRDDRARRLAR